jgi:hypothetical protein
MTTDTREAIARIVDPLAFELLDEIANPDGLPVSDYARKWARLRADKALAKASDILALTSAN